MQKRFPFMSLQNQYTYLNREESTDPLASYLMQLQQNNQKLPHLDKKYIQTAHKIQNKIRQVENLFELKRSRPNPLSQNRFNKPIIMPIYMPFPLAIPSLNFSVIPQVALMQNNLPRLPQPNQQPTVNKPQNPIKPQQQKKQQISKKPIQINKFSKKTKLNRFRIVAYAVYFCIYTKYFTRKFTQLRRNWFNDRYAINDGRIILEGSSKILKNLHQIDIYKMLQTAKQKAKQLLLQQQCKKTKLSDSVLILINFISLFLDYTKQYMSDKKFIKQNHEVFTVGVLNQNFMLSNLYLPQQAAILHIHAHGYIMVQQQIQIILIMIKLVLKILVYNYLLGLKFSRHWKNKQQKSHGLDDLDMQQLWKITRNAGIFLCIVCQEIYDKTYEEMVNVTYPFNFNQMAPKFNITAAKSLEQVKKSRQAQNPNNANSKLIINLDGYSDMQCLISSSQTLKKYKQKIKLKIIDILTNIYMYLKQEQAQVYDFMRNMTLDEEYVIFKGMKQENIKKKKKKKGGKGKNNQNQAVQNQYLRQSGYNTLKSNNNTYSNNKNMKKNNGNKDKDSQNSPNDIQSLSNIGNNDKKRSKIKNKSRWRQLEEQNIQQVDSKSEQSDKQQGKKKKKKLRFKHQQAFYDHKFDGHQKLVKLKEKMGKI